jgi:hypothetical protein
MSTSERLRSNATFCAEAPSSFVFVSLPLMYDKTVHRKHLASTSFFKLQQVFYEIIKHVKHLCDSLWLLELIMVMTLKKHFFFFSFYRCVLHFLSTNMLHEYVTIISVETNEKQNVCVQ